jgi:hypothetical protein
MPIHRPQGVASVRLVAIRSAGDSGKGGQPSGGHESDHDQNAGGPKGTADRAGWVCISDLLLSALVGRLPSFMLRPGRRTARPGTTDSRTGRVGWIRCAAATAIGDVQKPSRSKAGRRYRASWFPGLIARRRWGHVPSRTLRQAFAGHFEKRVVARPKVMASVGQNEAHRGASLFQRSRQKVHFLTWGVSGSW